MKVSQLLKLSTVVLALGAMPLHTAFANENENSDVGQSEPLELNNGSECADLEIDLDSDSADAGV